MQASRVVIAVIFFAIGALIAVPALTRTDSSSRASGTPTPTGTAAASATPTGSPVITTSPTRSAPSPARSSTRPAARPSGTPSVPPQGTQAAAPTRTAGTPTPPPSIRTPRPTLPTALPTTRPTLRPTARPSAGPTTPAPATPPLTARIGAVRCPARTVSVTLTSTSTQAEDYAVELDGAAIVAGRIPPQATRTTSVALREDRPTTVAVSWRNEPVRSAERTADCRRRTPPPDSLPNTGPDDATLYARIATGIAAMITGVIIFWYGGIWPRRRDRMLPEKKP